MAYEWADYKRNPKKRVSRNPCLNRGFHKNGCVRFGSGNRQHELAKFEKCWELKESGHTFATEVMFENGRIADIYDYTDNVVYEIVNSESEKSITLKRQDYGVRVEVINAEEKRH